jgi:hypothetical protein
MPAIRLSALAPAAALLLLAACGGDQAPAEEGASASGEILPASTSDAMLPLDSLRSQPPLMQPEPGGGAPAGDEAAEGDDAAEAGDAAPDDAAPAPAEEPSG